MVILESFKVIILMDNILKLFSKMILLKKKLLMTVKKMLQKMNIHMFGANLEIYLKISSLKR